MRAQQRQAHRAVGSGAPEPAQVPAEGGLGPAFFVFGPGAAWPQKEGRTMARKGDLKTVLHMNVNLDQELARAVQVGAVQNERTYNQEVRFRLRQAYGLDQASAEGEAGA
jgi:hypothetical protein